MRLMIFFVPPILWIILIKFTRPAPAPKDAKPDHLTKALLEKSSTEEANEEFTEGDPPAEHIPPSAEGKAEIEKGTESAEDNNLKETKFFSSSVET